MCIQGSILLTEAQIQPQSPLRGAPWGAPLIPDSVPRVSPTQQLQLQPAKVTKDFPIPSPGLNFQYPPSRKSVRKRPHFIQSIWSSRQPLRKNQSPAATGKHIWCSEASLFFRTLVPTPKYFPVCEIHLPTTVTASASPGTGTDLRSPDLEGLFIVVAAFQQSA